ncbi:MAG: hypothetical protein AB1563_02560 [Bacillota bacterium]
MGVGLLYTCIGQAQLSDPGQDQANIGFGRVVSDAEVLQFVQRHNVVLQAIFMWTAGFSGTHRAYEAKSAQALLQEARDKTVESFEKSLQNNPRAVGHFVRQHTEEEVLSDESLQTQARSLLNLRANFQTALTAAKQGAPLIYAIEVSGDTASIERLRGDPMVKAFQRAAVTGGRVVTPQTPKPTAYEIQYLDPVVQGLSVQDVYRQLQALAVITETKEGNQ